MGGDEVLVLIVAVGTTAVLLVTWTLGAARVARVRGWTRELSLLVAMPFAALGLLFAALLAWADPVVTSHAGYLLLFTGAGSIGMQLALFAARAFGIHPEHDARDAGSRAAVSVTCGALLGITLAFAGANAGVGPTIWTTFGPAFLGTILWLLSWTLAQLVGNFAEAVAVERDQDAGHLLAALLIGNGLIVGRAGAGDWVSAQDTVASLIGIGWPVLVLAAVAGGLRHARVSGLAATASSIGLVLAATAWVVAQGPW